MSQRFLLRLPRAAYFAQLERESGARKYRYDSLALLRSVSHLRSALPAAAVLPRAYTKLPSGVTALLNFKFVNVLQTFTLSLKI